MKYLVIISIAIMVARIDLILHGVEKVIELAKNRPAPSPTVTAASEPPTEVIPIPEDKALTSTPKSSFFNLLVDFHLDPTRETREKAAEILRKNPTIFSEKLDRVLEGEIHKFTDLIYNKDPELPFFLVDLVSLLKGENQEMVKRFFTIMLDNDIERFLMAYSRTKDSNCIIAGQLYFKVPEEELIHEFQEREEVIAQFLKKEKIDPALQSLAQKCQLVVKLQISKLTPLTPSSEPPQENSQEASNAPESSP